MSVRIKINNLTTGLILVAALLGFSHCRNEAGRDVPDVSDIDLEVQVKRFDRDLFALDTGRLETGLDSLSRRYPLMLPLFAGNIIRDQTNPAQSPVDAVYGFLTAPEVRRLYDTVQLVYPDLRPLEQDLTRLFRFYRYYFPDKPVPEVVAIVSEYATDAFTYGDSLAGIGLDMFLGEDYPAYDNEIFPSYLRRQFRAEYIPVRLARALAQNLAGDVPGQRLIDHMIHNGKILYVVDQLLPETPDSLKMGFTRDQMEGSQANEQEIWARLLAQNLLYSTDFVKFRKLVTPSPNAPIVFNEAPGEIGNWVGLQIVKAYMKRHPNTSLPELLKLPDAQKLLEEARYKPKRS
jgi:hypothetical protein